MTGARSDEIISKMKEICDQNIKNLYAAKFRTDFKARKLPNSHYVPFQTMLSTKDLTVYNEPKLETEKRAKIRQEQSESRLTETRYSTSQAKSNSILNLSSDLGTRQSELKRYHSMSNFGRSKSISCSKLNRSVDHSEHNVRI